MGLKSKHEFVFYQEDGTNELWLMNRDQTNCLCCKRKSSCLFPSNLNNLLFLETTQQTGLKQPDKTRNVHRSASPRIEKNDSQVTVITIQPGAARHIHSGKSKKSFHIQQKLIAAATSRQVSPNLPRRQIPQRPAKKEEQSFWQQCCGECSSICSNLFS